MPSHSQSFTNPAWRLRDHCWSRTMLSTVDFHCPPGYDVPECVPKIEHLEPKKSQVPGRNWQEHRKPWPKEGRNTWVCLKLDLPVYDLVSHHSPVFTTKTGCLNCLIHHFHPFSDHISSTWEFSSWFGLLGLLGFADGGRTVQLTAYRLQRSRSARAERRHRPQHALGHLWCLTLVGRSTRHGPQHALGQFCSDFANSQQLLPTSVQKHQLFVLLLNIIWITRIPQSSSSSSSPPSPSPSPSPPSPSPSPSSSQKFIRPNLDLICALPCQVYSCRHWTKVGSRSQVKGALQLCAFASWLPPILSSCVGLSAALHWVSPCICILVRCRAAMSLSLTYRRWLCRGFHKTVVPFLGLSDVHVHFDCAGWRKVCATGFSSSWSAAISL